MQTVDFPSKNFLSEGERLLKEGVDFCVVVRSSSKKKTIVRRCLDRLSGSVRNDGIVLSLLDKFRALDFYYLIAPAIHDYNREVTYDDQGDLRVKILTRSKTLRNEPH